MKVFVEEKKQRVREGDVLSRQLISGDSGQVGWGWWEQDGDHVLKHACEPRRDTGEALGRGGRR